MTGIVMDGVAYVFDRDKWASEGFPDINFEIANCKACGGPQHYKIVSGLGPRHVRSCKCTNFIPVMRLVSWGAFLHYYLRQDEHPYLKEALPEPEKSDEVHEYTVSPNVGDLNLKFVVLNEDKEIVAAADDPEILGKLIQLLMS